MSRDISAICIKRIHKIHTRPDTLWCILYPIGWLEGGGSREEGCKQACCFIFVLGQKVLEF